MQAHTVPFTRLNASHTCGKRAGVEAREQCSEERKRINSSQMRCECERRANAQRWSRDAQTHARGGSWGGLPVNSSLPGPALPRHPRRSPGCSPPALQKRTRAGLRLSTYVFSLLLRRLFRVGAVPRYLILILAPRHIADGLPGVVLVLAVGSFEGGREHVLPFHMVPRLPP